MNKNIALRSKSHLKSHWNIDSGLLFRSTYYGEENIGLLLCDKMGAMVASINHAIAYTMGFIGDNILCRFKQLLDITPRGWVEKLKLSTA